MRRTLIVAAVGAAATAILAVAGSGAAASKTTGETTFTVIQTTTSLKTPQGLSPGAPVVVTTTETSKGRQVGTTQVACTVIVGTQAVCQGTTFTSKGLIEGQGPIDISKPVGQLALVGGTGAYKTAHGFIDRKKLTSTTTQVTYHIFS